MDARRVSIFSVTLNVEQPQIKYICQVGSTFSCVFKCFYDDPAGVLLWFNNTDKFFSSQSICIYHNFDYGGWSSY